MLTQDSKCEFFFTKCQRKNRSEEFCEFFSENATSFWVIAKSRTRRLSVRSLLEKVGKSPSLAIARTELPEGNL